MNQSDLYIAVNDYRTKNGLSKLKQSREFEQMAGYRSYRLWSLKKLDHSEIMQPPFLYNELGEILARDFDNTKDIITAWKSSKTHKDILDKKYWTVMGVGIKDGYVCILFGRPWWRIW